MLVAEMAPFFLIPGYDEFFDESSDIHLYDPASETWRTELSVMATPRMAQAVFVVSKDICNWGWGSKNNGIEIYYTQDCLN